LSSGLSICYQEYPFIFLLAFFPVVLLSLSPYLKTLEVFLQNKLWKDGESQLEETWVQSKWLMNY